ncbi:MAG: phosphatase PAP2 family protein [Lachnospiraceae bacterium]|nr:phosphatase PAP2 family protein [Lachnospiraceae bacterium]
MTELILTAAWLDKTFYGFDNGILKALHSLGEATGYLANYFFRFITSFADGGYFMLAMCLAMILIPCIPAIYRKNPDKARNVIICGLAGFTAIALGAVITNLTIKRQVARIRPYEATQLYHDWWILAKGNIDKEFSFPSGHTTCTMAAMTSIFIRFNKKYSWTAFIFVILMGLSRNYLMMHYPTDIIGGILIGGISAVLTNLFWVFAFRKITELKEAKINRRS